MNPEPELIPQGDSWLVRTTEEPGKLRGQVVVNRRTKHELVYGHWEPASNKDGHITGHKVIGEAVHMLTGPNGKKALELQADHLNAKGEKPPEKTAKTRMDGFKQSFEQGGDRSLFDAMTLKSTISYEPKKD